MSRPYAEVIGDPIAHSKSPLIHNFWLAKLGIDAEYRACHVRPEELADYFAHRRGDTAWDGCNITIPHKVAALRLADLVDEAGCSAGATNTIFRRDASLAATNTDIDGVLSALPAALMPAGARVCILGTGGAARAAFAACKRRGVTVVLSSARNLEAGNSLLAEFGFVGRSSPLVDANNSQNANVIINATPLGMAGEAAMPGAVLDHVRAAALPTIVFDMVYSPLTTELLRAGRESGLRTIDGLAMLIGQAATAFAHFFGAPAPREHDAELRDRLTR